MARVRHLTKRYRTVTAVDDLSVEVGPGRVTGFLGPNGAGKTTTLLILLGLAAADGGAATINLITLGEK
jgi:ABC-2 type transport system ATP-binding protein